jgi:hypothetical protein
MTTYKRIVKNRNQLIADLMVGHFVNFDGYLLSKDLYQQISNITLLNSSLSGPRNMLFIHISQDSKKSIDPGIEKLFFKYRDCSENSELVKIQEEHFWKDAKMYMPHKKTLQDVVLTWIKNTSTANG